MITGIPGHRVEDVLLENIKISFPGGGTAADAARVVPEDVARYPEQFFFGVLPSSVLYARHVSGLTVRNLDAAGGVTGGHGPYESDDPPALSSDRMVGQRRRVSDASVKGRRESGLAVVRGRKPFDRSVFRRKRMNMQWTREDSK
ncbi:MAG: hypothetical protein WCK89_10580 [bacterium]